MNRNERPLFSELVEKQFPCLETRRTVSCFNCSVYAFLIRSYINTILNFPSCLTTQFDTIKMLLPLELCQKFRAISSLEATAGSLMNSWPEWRDKLIWFSKMESGTRPVLKKLLSDMDSQGVVHPDCNTNIFKA